ncbi:MAG: 50S ribosomal protein L21 [Bdellovibrionales bacterium]|nr:50S ribosomal protein L21 [Bdellovibrionales bacterium]
MYAVIQKGVHQYKVHLGQFLKLEKLQLRPGQNWKCQQVLLFQEEDGHLVSGQPYIKTAEVQARIIRHGKSKKVLVFKKNRRKGYRRTKGHRQEFTEVYIEALCSPSGKWLKKKYSISSKATTEKSGEKIKEDKQKE